MAKGIIQRIIAPTAIFVLTGSAICWFILPQLVSSTYATGSKRTAVQLANQFKVLRGYYTHNVVAKVIADGNLSVNSQHASEEKTIPLPATLIHDISDLFKNEDLSISLYSPFPFPNRGRRVLDAFQKAAWISLKNSPKSVFARESMYDGKPVLRVAIADIMVDGACVNCHNNHPETPKNDWKVGDIRGVLEVGTSLVEQGKDIENLVWQLMLLLLIGGVLLLAVGRIGDKKTSVPLLYLTQTIAKISAGKQQNTVIYQEREDEIGDLAKGVEHFRQHLVERECLEREHQEAQAARVLESQRRDEASKELLDCQRDEHLSNFEHDCQNVVHHVIGSTMDLQQLAKQMVGLSERTFELSKQANDATSSTDEHVDAVSHLTSKLEGMVQAVAGKVHKATAITQHAVTQVRQSSGQIKELDAATIKISGVLKLIQHIASQTNLLALNASIEAVGAGDAGKGFGVVADEVKFLANQTADATDEIGDRVSEMHKAVQGAVSSMVELSTIIVKVNNISNEISETVGSQVSATIKITQRMEKVVTSTSQLSSMIGKVGKAADESGEAVGLVQQASGSLSQSAEHLRGAVKLFLRGLRDS